MLFRSSWNSDRTRPFAGKKPEPGNRVVFNRYAGRVLRGTDGKMYRLMTDNCIGAIMTMETDNA